MDKIEILGIVGNLRKDSYNRFALKAAQEHDGKSILQAQTRRQYGFKFR